jgi:regulator of replication initiation timing
MAEEPVTAETIARQLEEVLAGIKEMRNQLRENIVLMQPLQISVEHIRKVLRQTTKMTES